MCKLLLILTLVSYGFCADFTGISIKKLERKIDVSTQNIKINSKLSLENSGSSNAGHFWYTISEVESENAAFLSVLIGGVALEIAKQEKEGENVLLRFDFKSPLAPGKTLNVDVENILTSVLHPFPKSIRQGEKQFMEFSYNHYFYTPYQVNTEITTVTLFSANVLSYSRLKPSSHIDTTITYGPYENVAPFSVDPMKIHFENNSPFIVVTDLKRVIEVSHWGNIAVEETIEVQHTGALLKGSFSRYDYQRDHNTYASVKSFKTILPASAKDVYYRDEIGNISTSNMRVSDELVELDLRPRFPLFGGWKTKYTVGYNMPSYEHLYNSGNKFTLKMRFLDHIYDDMVVENMLLKIILPETVQNVKLATPFEVTRLQDDVHYTYLDTFGRSVVSATKKNLVENHIQDFELSYEFNLLMMLREPFLVCAAFLLLFFVVIVYVRLDFTLSKDDFAESAMRVSSHCEFVQHHHDARAAQYEKFDEEIQKLKSSKEISHAQVATKKIMSAIRDETQAISDLATKIRVDNNDVAEKVTELQKNDKLLFEALQQQLGNTERFASGKMSKQNYVEAENVMHKKKEALVEKVKFALSNI